MSQENVEMVRRIVEAEGARDDETIFGLYHPTIEWDASRAGAGVVGTPEILRGHEGVRTWFRSWYAQFQEIRFEIEELIAAGDRVYLAAKHTGRGKSSGADVAMMLYGVWTIRDGLVISVVWFLERWEALEAVGLSD
jgi:ketosteroid isomerase-like protein